MTRNIFLIGPQLTRNIISEFIHGRPGEGKSECHEKSHRIRKHETVSDTHAASEQQNTSCQTK